VKLQSTIHEACLSDLDFALVRLAGPG
jgi:hypothetical protein